MYSICMLTFSSIDYSAFSATNNNIWNMKNKYCMQHRASRKQTSTTHERICIIIPMDPLQEDSCLSSASQLVGHHILHGEIHCITMLSEFTTRATTHTCSTIYKHDGSIARGREAPATYSDRNTVWHPASSVSRQPASSCQIRGTRLRYWILCQCTTLLMSSASVFLSV